MEPTRRPTLRTVAERAYVSRATASRAITGSPLVSADVRARVLAVAQEVGYVPNKLARGLTQRRTGTVAIVSCGDATPWDPFTAEMTAAIGAELHRHELNPVWVGAPLGPGYAHAEEYLAGGSVDGVAVLGLRAEHPLTARLLRAGVPTVLSGRPMSATQEVSFVDVDNKAGAAAAVRWLREQGRVRIATITGPGDMAAGVDRLAGYRTVLAAAGDHDLIASADWTAPGAERATADLLAREPKLDAVFAASDLMAVGAYRALRRAGRRIPDDVALFGFDGLASLADSWLADVALSTVRQPVAEIGRQIARQLAHRIGAGAPDPGDHLMFRTELVFGRTA